MSTPPFVSQGYSQQICDSCGEVFTVPQGEMVYDEMLCNNCIHGKCAPKQEIEFQQIGFKKILI